MQVAGEPSTEVVVSVLHAAPVAAAEKFSALQGVLPDQVVQTIEQTVHAAHGRPCILLLIFQVLVAVIPATCAAVPHFHGAVLQQAVWQHLPHADVLTLLRGEAVENRHRLLPRSNQGC